MIDKVAFECTGCGACGDICPVGAISFKINREGFSYPVINNELCTSCQLCERVCPACEHKCGNPLSDTYASYSTSNPNESSSGGLFAAIASYIISDNGVVYGAAFNDKLVLSHVRCYTVSDLFRLCGTKYVQSNCCGIYKQVQKDLNADKKVLFSGTPCQVSGFRKYLRKEYENLYTIDLICHGVPSPGIFADYIHYCERLRKKEIAGFYTRDNREGWDNKFRSTILFKDGREEYNSMLSNLWNRIFFSELATRPSCSNCKYASMERQGDLTLGDFWGVERECPEMYQEMGVSLIGVNTNKGKELLDTIDSIRIKAAVTSEKEHPNLYHPTPTNSRRDTFMADYANLSFESVVEKYFGYSRWLDIKTQVKSFLNKLFK